MLERLRFTRIRGRMLFYLLTIVPQVPCSSHDSEVMTLHECIIMSRSQTTAMPTDEAQVRQQERATATIADHVWVRGIHVSNEIM